MQFLFVFSIFQVLSSGCGLVHSESPISDEVVTGVQIFVNIPGEHKLSPPTYQCHPSQDISTAINEGVKVNMIVGEAFGNKVSKIPKNMHYHLSSQWYFETFHFSCDNL